MLLFSTKVSQAAFTKVIMPVIGRKGTIKRGKYQRKINFSLNFQAKVPYLKVQLSEENTKGKLVFLSTFSGKCQPFQENDCQLFQENVNDFRK